MNKIKVLYDVVKVLREKEVFSGTLTVEGKKNGAGFLSLMNQFTKNTRSGETKAKINFDLDLEEGKIKHESDLAFKKTGCCHHGMFHHMKSMQHGENAVKCTGVKSKLSKIAFVLNVLNSLKAEEKGEGFVLSLDLKGLPDIKEIIQARMNHRHNQEGKHHAICKEFCDVEFENMGLQAWINKKYEVEKIEVAANGSQKDQSGQISQKMFLAAVNFVW